MTVELGKVCVYSHWSGDELVYIGKGVPSRPYEFFARSEKWKSFFKDKKNINIKILGWFESDDEAKKFERKLIRERQPKCNIQYTKDAQKPRLQKGQAKKNFSISLRPSEIEAVDNYAKKLSDELGYKVSRNEIIRKATLKYIEYLENEYGTMD